MTGVLVASAAHAALAASTTSVPGAISPPSIEYGQLAPMLVVFGAAVVAVLVEAFTPRPLRRPVQLVITLGSLAAAFVLTIVTASDSIFDNGSSGHVAAVRRGRVDRPTLFIQGTILVLAIASVLLIADTSNNPFAAEAAAPPGSPEERERLVAGITHTEIFPLTLFAVGGMLLFPASNDLLTMFVALEVLSLPLYLLCGLARRRRLLSHEAAMKYFLLGAFSSAFFLFGIAMLYGFAGSVSLPAIASAAATNTSNSTLLYAGIALTGTGLLFKVGAVPFHSWKPDVYQGAPTPVTALMASCTVVSAFGALLRVFYVAFGNLTWDWRPGVPRHRHRDHGRGRRHRHHPDGREATARLLLDRARRFRADRGHRDQRRRPVEQPVLPGHLRADHGGRVRGDHPGTGRRRRGRAPVPVGGPGPSGHRWWRVSSRCSCSPSPGIPLTSGFTGKFAIFQAAIAAGETPLVIVGVLSSAIAAFFYVRVIVLMFFSDPVPDGPEVVVPNVYSGAAVGLGVAATVVFGIVPEPLLSLACDAANTLFVS